LRPSKPISAIIEAFLTGPYSEPRMTQENSTLASAMEPGQTKPKHWSKPNPALLAALLALALASGVLIQETRNNRDLRQTLALTQKEQATLLRQQQDAILRLQQQETALARNETRLNETQQQQAALASMYDALTRTESTRSLVEIEQMLTLASQQLQLTRQTTPAIAVLKLIEQRMAGLNRPEHIQLRRVIQKELTELSAFPVLDLTGASSRLDTLIDVTDNLPLLIDTRRGQPAPRTPSEGDRLSRIAREIWHDLKQLIQIRRTDKPDAVLLAPEQAFFLRENIKLRLLNARAALLSHDDKVFHSELKAVHRYLDQHFDAQAPAVATAKENLRALEALKINPLMPDLAASLNAIRQTREMNERVKP